jgi:hypothetical protein
MTAGNENDALSSKYQCVTLVGILLEVVLLWFRA